VILEGGELGYSLSTAYGSVLDNPNLITVCMVGDGEAETGPLATAWHLNKIVSPLNNGAVLPVLHLNGYKISGPTFMGRMSDSELIKLFEGYGYEPHIVDAYTEADVHERMRVVLDHDARDVLPHRRDVHQASADRRDVQAQELPRVERGRRQVRWPVGRRRVRGRAGARRVVDQAAQELCALGVAAQHALHVGVADHRRDLFLRGAAGLGWTRPGHETSEGT